VSTAVVGACPLHAHWLDGEPITDALPMGGIVDRYRRLPADVTGFALLADAFACTNPSLGRGMTLGLRHAQALRDTAREEDPARFAKAWDAATEAELTPWYRATVAIDRDRGVQGPGPGYGRERATARRMRWPHAETRARWPQYGATGQRAKAIGRSRPRRPAARDGAWEAARWRGPRRRRTGSLTR
jgi:hypothetical protein